MRVLVSPQDLDEANVTWRGYFDLAPISWQFTYNREHLDNYRVFDIFAQDVANGDMANYSALCVMRCCVIVTMSSFVSVYLQRSLTLVTTTSLGEFATALLLCRHPRDELLVL